MRYILFWAFLLISLSATAGEIMQLPEDYMLKQSFDRNNMDISMSVNAKKDVNHDIAYMMINYSAEEMAQYAIRINKAERQAAADAGQSLPPKLSKEILQNKELIAKYLRSRYNITK